MKKIKFKKFLYVFLALFLVYALWLAYNLFGFKTYTFTTASDNYHEIQGSYHLHTSFSDGRRPLEKIAKIASSASLDFIILTDHGNPNYESLQSQGWIEGVLVLAGSELSVSRGHMVAIAFQNPSSPFSQNAEVAAGQIKVLEGFSIISHPFSKASWTWGESVFYQGLEIINSDSMLKKNFFSTLPYIPALMIKPEYTLLKMIDYPAKNLEKWDQLNIHHSLYGYFSADAHFLYRPLFSLLRLHVLLKNPLSSDFQEARDQVYEALRYGRFFNAIEAAAESMGFRFSARKGKKTSQMGETIVLDSPVTLRIKAPFPYAKEIRLIRNGNSILLSHKKRLSFVTTNPGTYRAEVYLKEKTPLNKNVPWIISNPIFLRKDEE